MNFGKIQLLVTDKNMHIFILSLAANMLINIYYFFFYSKITILFKIQNNNLTYYKPAKYKHTFSSIELDFNNTKLPINKKNQINSLK